MGALDLRYVEGCIHLPALGLWLDPPRPRPGLVFVSHAHSDHTARHREVVLTAPTARFMQLRLGGNRRNHVLPYGEPREFGSGGARFRLTLLPAGHILGSAMALIEADGESLLYTGDFKLGPGHAAEACELRTADVLVMETTFGRPQYVFPPPHEVWSGMAAFCRTSLAEGVTPVLLCYSLGKAQEVLRGLAEFDFEFALHEKTHRMTQAYVTLGMRFPPYETFDPNRTRGKVVVWPPGGTRAKARPPVGSMKRALVSGWAMDSSCQYRYGVDAAFAVSDHADFPGLLEAVRRVAPRKVWTLHGYASEFAGTLRSRGYEAFALSEDDQLTLRLGL